MKHNFSELTETLETLANSCERLLAFITAEHGADPIYAQEIATLRLVATSSRRAALWSRQMFSHETRTH